MRVRSIAAGTAALCAALPSERERCDYFLLWRGRCAALGAAHRDALGDAQDRLDNASESAARALFVAGLNGEKEERKSAVALVRELIAAGGVGAVGAVAGADAPPAWSFLSSRLVAAAASAVVTRRHDATRAAQRSGGGAVKPARKSERAIVAEAAAALQRSVAHFGSTSGAMATTSASAAMTMATTTAAALKTVADARVAFGAFGVETPDCGYRYIAFCANPSSQC